MSRDDEFDYRIMYPIEGRNRKRRSANPRQPKPQVEPHGFFATAAKKPEAGRSQPRPRDLGKRYEDDSRPMPTLKTLARRMIAKDLDRSNTSIAAELEELGYEAPKQTISIIREEMMDTLRLCRRYRTIIIPAWDD